MYIYNILAIIQYEVLEIVYLYVKTKYNGGILPDVMYYASQNENYVNSLGGIGGKMIKSVFPIINTLDELYNFVKNYDYSKVLAYIGTSTYLLYFFIYLNLYNKSEREKLDDLLKIQDKILFSIHYSAGEECFQQIIQIGQLPHHYVMSVYSYFSIRYNDCVIISDGSETTIDYADYFMKVSEKFSFICNKIIVNGTDEIDDAVEEIKNYNNTVIYLLLSYLTEDFISAYVDSGLSNENNTVVLLDYQSSLFLENENKTLYENCYGVSFYSINYESDANKNKIKQVEMTYGQHEKQINQISVGMYNNIYLEIWYPLYLLLFLKMVIIVTLQN